MNPLYRNVHVGIAINEYRRAALYFDYVIPVFHLWNPDAPFGDPNPESSECPPELFPPGYTWIDAAIETQSKHRPVRETQESSTGYSTVSISPFVLDYICLSLQKRQRNNRTYDRSLYQLLRGEKQLPKETLASAINQLSARLNSSGYLGVPVLDTDWINPAGATGFEAISITSTSLLDIDTSRTEWHAIREFRRDTASRKSLKKYRLFWYENYADKSRNYIEDDLGQRYDAFMQACAKHGFDTIETSLSTVLNSKSLMAFGALSLTASWLGYSATVPEIILSGTIVEIGKLSLSIAKSRMLHAQYVQCNELAYLYQLSRHMKHSVRR